MMTFKKINQIIVVLFLFTASTLTNAKEWNGQSIFSGDWSDAGNWALCSGLLGCEGPESDETADFGPLGIRVTTNVDYARSIKGIKYEIGARLYSISGSELTLGSDGISNFSGEDQVINSNLKLSANQRWGQQIILDSNNASLQINGNVNLNGKQLALGTTRTRTFLDFIDVPRTWVDVDGAITGSGTLQADGALLTGRNRFSGNILIQTGGALLLTGNDASLQGSVLSASPDVVFKGSPSDNTLLFNYGLFRVEDGAVARVDRVTAENDYHGKLIIGSHSELSIGAGNSSFTLNALIRGEGVHNDSLLYKDGSGTVIINTESYDAEAPPIAGSIVGTGGVKTIVRNGRLTLTGNHTGDHDFEVLSAGQLDLDVAQGLSRTLTHRITGDGRVAKTGAGIAFLNSPLAFTGDFDMEEGQVFLDRDDVFSGENTLNLNAGVFNLNGHDVAFARIVNGFGRIDLDGGQLTIGRKNIADGKTTLNELDHSGTGALVKTGLDDMDFFYKWGQFDGSVKVEQGTLSVFVTGKRGRARSIFDLEMTGGRLEQNTSFHEFRTANTQVGSVLDLNNTETTFGQLDVDAGAQSKIMGELLGSGKLNKTGLEDLVLDDFDAFTGQLAINQGKVIIGDTDTNASGISIAADGELEVGHRVNEVIASAITGSGLITKNEITTTTITDATGFNGSIVINRGKLSTGTSTTFGNEVDVHIVKGSFGGNIFIDPIENQLDVNAEQGFGKLTGNGIVDFSRNISVGNGNKSGAFDGTLRSAGGATLTKKGTGKIVLDKDQDYRGTTRVEEGELQINGKLHADTGLNSGINNVIVANAAGDAKLSGSGQVGRITGNGIVAPGESPGILTAHSIDVSGGLDFEFEFTGLAPDYGDADKSINDLIRMTDISSLSGTLSTENVFKLFLDIDSPLDGLSVDGGFFSRRPLSSFLLELASFEIFVEDVLGDDNYEGKNYTALNMDFWEISFEQVFLSKRFEGDNFITSGYVTRFTFNDITPAAVPLPGSAWLMLSALGGFGFLARRTKR